MDIEHEVLREFNRVVMQCGLTANMPSNLSISDIPGLSDELGEAGFTVAAAPEVKAQPPEVMKGTPEMQDVVNATSFSPEEVVTPQLVNWKLDKLIPQFVLKVYEIVDDPTTDHVVHWGFGGESFVVQDKDTFCAVILPRYFKHVNFSSFIRQLNSYGFRKIDCDKWEFATRGFQRGKIHQLKYIKRIARENKMKGTRSGKHDEIFQKSMKGMSALISNLSQQVEVSESIISAFEKRVQVVESKYKQLACVLSKTIQNPSFIAELLKRQTTVEPKHDGDGETSTDKEMVDGETDGTSKFSLKNTQVLLTSNAKEKTTNQVEIQLSVNKSAQSIGESSSSPKELQGSAAEMMLDSVQALDNELMNEVEPCEGMTAENCMYYFCELKSLIGEDESNDDWVAYAANQPVDIKPKHASVEV